MAKINNKAVKTIAKLMEEGFVTEKDGVYKMTLKGAFYYHYYENFYTLAYIDKMWSILRKQAFPKNIKLQFIKKINNYEIIGINIKIC